VRTLSARSSARNLVCKGGKSAEECLPYQTEDGQVRLDLRLQDETVWLTQPSMAVLFQTTQQNISRYIRNIFEQGELTPEVTHKKFLLVRREGKRDDSHEVEHGWALSQTNGGR